MGIFEPMSHITRLLLLSPLMYFLGLPMESLSQPLPDGKETLSVEATSWEIAVPPQENLSGGHLQGIQYQNGKLIVSGSSKRFGYLLLFQQLGTGFQFIGLKKLARTPLNHAGGFQVDGNWLAIGLEDPGGKRESIIQLLDVSSFESFSKPPVYSLKRVGEPKVSTAGAVALIKRNDHFLLAVGTWDCTTIDFYTSNGVDPYKEDFNFEPWTTWDSREAVRKKWSDKDFGSYQNLQLTEDSTGLYITGFCRSRSGVDRADVFRLDVESDKYHLMQKVAAYSVQCKGDVTFRNGAGFSTYDGKPSIISVGHNTFPKMHVQVFPITGY